MKLNPELDLKLERVVDVPPELVWKCWTTPEHILKWFTPRPWKTIECEIDLKPGGKFKTVMQSPEGEKYPGMGCYLEIVQNKKLVWTSALLPEFRPVAKPINGADLLFTGVILIEPYNGGTKYTAIAMHADPESCKTHKEMGFEQGWSAALDQLVELAKTF